MMNALIAFLAKETAEEHAPPTLEEDVPHCAGCGDFLYDYTKFVYCHLTGQHEPTDWCCDCYPHEAEDEAREAEMAGASAA
jgi:hypothetical protein